MVVGDHAAVDLIPVAFDVAVEGNGRTGARVLVAEVAGADVAAAAQNRNGLTFKGFGVLSANGTSELLMDYKAEHPEAPVAAHPECPPHVIDHADYVGSTSGILEFAQNFPGDTLIVATEPHIIHQMEKAVPSKRFIGAPGADGNCNCNICPYMALNTMVKLYVALRDLQPRIEIEEGLRLAARKSLDRMLEMASGTIGMGDLGRVD